MTFLVWLIRMYVIFRCYARQRCWKNCKRYLKRLRKCQRGYPKAQMSEPYSWKFQGAEDLGYQEASGSEHFRHAIKRCMALSSVKKGRSIVITILAMQWSGLKKQPWRRRGLVEPFWISVERRSSVELYGMEGCISPFWHIPQKI